MLVMVHSSCAQNIEYGTFLRKKHKYGVVYPDIICHGSEGIVNIEGYSDNYVGKFHTHPRTSYEESWYDHVSMLQALSEHGTWCECVYGFKERAIKCTKYHCTAEEKRVILKFLPAVQNEDMFRVKFAGSIQKLTNKTQVYTIRELEKSARR